LIQECTAGRKDLDSIIEVVRYEDSARFIAGNAGRLPKLPGISTERAPGEDKLTSTCELADAVVSLVGDIDETGRIDGNAPRRDELTCA
jgi:hypothetical protein